MRAPTAQNRTNHPLKQAVTGTYRWLCTEYLTSVEFRQLELRTQRVRRGILQSTFEEKVVPTSVRVFADVPASELTSEAIRVLRDRKAAVPEGANSRLKAIRQVFTWALGAGVTYNPARDVP